MILIKRDNFNSRCYILEREITRSDLATYLEIIKEQYEAEGWHAVWDDETIKYSLMVFRGQYECLTFVPFHGRVPVRKDWFDW